MKIDVWKWVYIIGMAVVFGFMFLCVNKPKHQQRYQASLHKAEVKWAGAIPYAKNKGYLTCSRRLSK